MKLTIGLALVAAALLAVPAVAAGAAHHHHYYYHYSHMRDEARRDVREAMRDARRAIADARREAWRATLRRAAGVPGTPRATRPATHARLPATPFAKPAARRATRTAIGSRARIRDRTQNTRNRRARRISYL